MTPPERPSRRDILRASAGISGGLVFGGVASGTTSGIFEVTDPTEIATVEDLQAIRDDLTSDYLLVDDIDLSGITNFEPIGDESTPFLGTLDGNDHTISGLTIDRPDENKVGLFGAVGMNVGQSGGTILNINLDTVDVQGGSGVGTLVGLNHGNISGVNASGMIAGTEEVGGLIGRNISGCVWRSHTEATVTGDETIGGLVGWDGSFVSESSTTGNVTGEYIVGGLIGESNGYVRNSHATGDVTGTPESGKIGGLVGQLSGGKVSKSTAEGPVTGYSAVGGLVGWASGTVEKSVAEGEVTGGTDVGGLMGEGGGIVESTAHGKVSAFEGGAGGLVGRAKRNVLRSHATGTVEGNGGLGGLIGVNRKDTFISRSFATGDVTGTGDFPAVVGGLIGTNDGNVSESYATGNVSGRNNVGGLIGINDGVSDGNIVNSYATGDAHAWKKDAGGLVGLNSGKIIESYATGSVTVVETNAGGLVGRVHVFEEEELEMTDSYWDTNTTGQGNAVGLGPAGTNLTGLTTSQMQGSAAESNMSALDFAETWEPRTDPDDYPALAWHTRLIWRFQAGERITGSPTVVDGTVFIGPDWGAGGCEPNVHAVDAESGQREWTFEKETDATGPYLNDEYLAGGPTGAVHVVDGTAFMKFRQGEIVAVDAATGEKQWQAEMESNSGGRGSPTAYEDTLFDRDGEWLYWFDVDTGERKRRIRLGDFTPVVVVNGTVYAAGVDTTGQGLFAVNAQTGDMEWRFGGVTPVSDTSPTVANGTVYVGSISGFESSSLVAVDAATGELEWEYELEAEITNTPTVADGIVYFSAGRFVYALNAGQGELAWKQELSVAGLGSSPTVADDTVFVGATLEVEAPSRGGTEIPEGVDVLIALDAATGDIKWWFDATPYDMLLSSPTVVDGVVYVGSSGGFLYALDADIEGSSEGSRVNLGTLGHHHVWAEGVTDTSPEAAFTVNPESPTVGDVVTFDASDSSSPTGDIVEYRWDFIGDGQFERTTPDPVVTYTYDAAGEYDVTLTVTNTEDESDMASQTVSVVSERAGPPPLPGQANPPQDLDGDGLYEDIDGNSEFSIGDVQLFFQHRNADVVQDNAEFFNFSGTDPEQVSIGDVQALFQLFRDQG